jgi:hypothetical protein
MNDNNKYLQCDRCAEERSVAGLSFAVTPGGHLLVTCLKHRDGAVVYLHNEDVAEELRNLAGSECGCATHKKETQH